MVKMVSTNTRVASLDATSTPTVTKFKVQQETRDTCLHFPLAFETVFDSIVFDNFSKSFLSRKIAVSVSLEVKQRLDS